MGRKKAAEKKKEEPLFQMSELLDVEAMRQIYELRLPAEQEEIIVPWYREVSQELSRWKTKYFENRNHKGVRLYVRGFGLQKLK